MKVINSMIVASDVDSRKYVVVFEREDGKYFMSDGGRITKERYYRLTTEAAEACVPTVEGVMSDIDPNRHRNLEFERNIKKSDLHDYMLTRLNRYSGNRLNIECQSDGIFKANVYNGKGMWYFVSFIDIVENSNGSFDFEYNITVAEKKGFNVNVRPKVEFELVDGKISTFDNITRGISHIFLVIEEALRSISLDEYGDVDVLERRLKDEMIEFEVIRDDKK